jgi:hypothetical protein
MNWLLVSVGGNYQILTALGMRIAILRPVGKLGQRNAFEAPELKGSYRLATS